MGRGSDLEDDDNHHRYRQGREGEHLYQVIYLIHMSAQLQAPGRRERRRATHMRRRNVASIAER
jgi:hypothetical protein